MEFTIDSENIRDILNKRLLDPSIMDLRAIVDELIKYEYILNMLDDLNGVGATENPDYNLLKEVLSQRCILLYEELPNYKRID